MSNARNAVIGALDEIGIPHQDGPEGSLVFVLNHVDAGENISFFVSFGPDDDTFVTMGAHIWECGREVYTLGMAIAGNVNATAKVAKIFPLHMPMADDECEDGCGCGCHEEHAHDDSCGCGCGDEECGEDEGCCEDEGCGCGCDEGDENMRAHFFVTSQFFWGEEKLSTKLLTAYINAALAARQDFMAALKDFPDLPN